jgi:hypothetical protein
MAAALVPAVAAGAEELELSAETPSFVGKAVTISTVLEGNRNIDIPGKSVAKGVQAIIWGDTVGANQRFIIEDAGTDGDDKNLYYLRNINSDLVLDIYGAQIAKGSAIIQWPQKTSGAENQKWYIEENENDSYTFTSALDDSYCLDVFGGKNADGGKLILWERGENQQNQQWLIDEVLPTVEDGIYTIKTAGSSGRLLDVSGNSTKDGAKIILWDATGGSNQQFELFFIPETGYYVFIGVASDKLLDVFGNSTAAGAQIIQYELTGGLNQQFSIVATDAGYKIIGARNGLALDVSGGSGAAGANIIAWPWHGGLNQQWIFDSTDIAFTLYSQISDGTPTIVEQYTQSELEAFAAAYTEPAAYVTSRHGEWKAYVSRDYIPILDLLASEGLEFSSGDVLVTSTRDNYVSTNDDITWQMGNSQKYYYPATTATGLVTDGAVETPMIIALTYASTAAAGDEGVHLDSTAAVAVEALLADYEAQAAYSENDIPRNLLGASPEQSASNRFAKQLNALTLVEPGPLQSFEIWEQNGSAEPTLSKTFTADELTALTQTDPRAFLMSGHSGAGWQVFATDKYIPIDDLLSAAGVSFAAGDSIEPEAGDGFSKVTSYEDYTAAQYFYPATTATQTSLDGEQTVGAVLAYRYVQGAVTSTAGATATELLAGPQKNESRWLIGLSQADYQAGAAYGNRLVTGPIKITIIHPELVPLSLAPQAEEAELDSAPSETPGLSEGTDGDVSADGELPDVSAEDSETLAPEAGAGAESEPESGIELDPIQEPEVQPES